MAIESLYPNIKPSLNLDFANVEALDPRITFTRTTTATYYDGITTAKAEENLISFSQEFDNGAWAKFNATVTANNTTAPDGTSTAELFAETTANGLHYLEGGTNIRFGAVSGQAYVFSVFMKKGTGATAPDIMQLSFGAGGFASTVYANYDLDGGTVSASGAGITSATITPVGNGWYRCSFVATANATANATLDLFFANNTGAATRAQSYTGATTSDVFIWGAQVEQRSAVTAYTPTTTQPITNYIPVLLTAPAGVARFDHNPVTGESLGLLVEEQRTNLLTYSDDFANASWTKTNSSVTGNTIVAPDGTLTGDKVIADDGVQQEQSAHVNKSVASGTSGVTYSLSVFMKAAERRYGTLRIVESQTAITRAYFDLQDGVVVAASTANCTASIQSVGNGWYRCTIVFTTQNTSNITTRICGSTGSSNATSGDGDGYSGIYIWGAQLEAGAFPTSYIPTVGSTVTRNADVATMTGTNFSSWYRADEGTMYAEAAVIGSTGVTQPILHFNLNNADTPRTMLIRRGDGKIGFNVFATTTSADIDSGVTATVRTFVKSAGTYKINDFAVSANAATPVLDSIGDVAIVNQAGIGFRAGVNTYLNGTIKKIAYYPSRLPDAQLQALTTV